MEYSKFIKKIFEATYVKGDTADVKSRIESAFTILDEFVKKSHIQSEKFQTACQNILLAVNYGLDGNQCKAIELIHKTYFEKNVICIRTASYPSGVTPFYRIRNAADFICYKEDEMYHIPFDMIEEVNNERFSINGFPTFYLASSAYCCWEETGRKEIDYANVALFKTQKDVSFIDLTWPNPNKRVKDDDILYTLPLIIACSLHVRKKDKNFKPEYIIPQCLMDCVRNFRDQNSGTQLIGIQYNSIHNESDKLLFDNNSTKNRDLFINYAIPNFGYHERGICPVIKSIFQHWDTVSWKQLHITQPAMLNKYSEDGKYHYDVSIFGRIEEYLNTRNPQMLTYHSSRYGGIAPGMLTR